MNGLAEATRTDAELVQLAQAGDGDAFRELFDRHRDRVAAVCRQRLRSPADVDDAVQEAFVRALTNLGQLREHGNFGAWIRSIAIRACMNHHRAARRVMLTDDGEQNETPDAGPLPEDLVLSAERGASLRATFAELGERDRRALWMRHVAEAPVADVALELGLTEGSTRVLLTRARHRLRAATMSLPAFIPLSWRQWFRDHLPATTPALDALVVAVALTVAGAGTAGVVADRRALDLPRPAEVSAQADAERPARGAVDRAQRKLDARAPAAGTAADRPAAAAAAAAPDADAPQRPLGRLRNTVQIRDEKPGPEETDELVDVDFFAGETELNGPQENELTVYGREAKPLVDAAQQTARGVGLVGSQHRATQD